MGNPLETLPQLRPIDLGAGVRIDTPVILAPMSGVTDLPFRRLARELGAGLVVWLAGRQAMRMEVAPSRHLSTSTRPWSSFGLCPI